MVNRSSDVNNSSTTARPEPDLVLQLHESDHDPTLVQTPEVLATGQRPSLPLVFLPRQSVRLRGPDDPIASPTYKALQAVGHDHKKQDPLEQGFK
jgi:hypothetical protein